MSKYIRLFDTTSQYNAYTADTANFIKPNVSCALDDLTTVHYNPYVPQHDYSQDYLTFKALSQGTMTIYRDEEEGSPTTISYSTDNGTTWTQITTSIEPYTVGTFNVGDKLLLKGNNSSYHLNVLIGGTATLEVCGNIMSMLYGDNFVGQTTLTEPDTFESFFYVNTNLISAENLILPATTLADGCYESMFQSCTSLTTAPSVLPATTLAVNCYFTMFQSCTSLTTAPELPATTLADGCYVYMFSGCTSLNYIKAMFTTTPSSSYTYDWVSGVASSGTFVKNAAATWTSSCGTSTYPCNWDVQTTSS